MPASKIGFNLDTRRLLNATGASMQAFSAKAGNVIDFELSIIQNSTPVSLPANSTVHFALKQSSAAAGTYIFDTFARRSGWGSGSRWFFRLDLTGSAFDPFLGKALDAEILIEVPDDGQRIACLTSTFTLLKNVIP